MFRNKQFKKHLRAETWQKISRKRFYRSQRSRLKRKLLRGGHVRGGLKKKYRIKKIDLRARAKWRAAKGQLKLLEINIPENLNFFKNPKETSIFFNRLEKEFNESFDAWSPARYHISHQKTTSLGLAESFLFDRLIREQKARWAVRNMQINFSGRLSSQKTVNNFLLSFGVLKELGIKANFSQAVCDQDYEDKYLTYRMPGSRTRNADKGKASFDLINYFDKCLRYNSFLIKDDAKSDLTAGIGEIIGNAEEHSGEGYGDWYALGCYDKDNHACQFAIINFGRTIYENLSDTTSTAAEVIREIEETIMSHRSYVKMLKDYLGDKFAGVDHNEEPIWNVMALQDGISSQRTVSGVGSTRGQGIMDFLQFIDGIKTKGTAEIFLLSGHSLIKIDYDYPIVAKLIGAQKEARRRIVFNKLGNLQHPSDMDKVMYLKDKFQGTIFAGRFEISREHLIEQQGRRKENVSNN